MSIYFRHLLASCIQVHDHTTAREGFLSARNSVISPECSVFTGKCLVTGKYV